MTEKHSELPIWLLDEWILMKSRVANTEIAVLNKEPIHYRG